MTKRAILAAFCAVLLAGFLAADKATTVDQSKCPVGKMKFNGGIYFGTSSTGRVDLYMSTVYVWKGTVAAPGGTMTLMGSRARSDGNRYILTINRITIAAGDPVIMTFQPPWTGLPLYTATIAAPVFIRYLSPANEAIVRLSAVGSLPIIWSGGTPPYVLNIRQLDPERSVFNLRGIAGTRVDVPLRTFAPARRYHVTVYDAGRRFVFDRDVDPATDLYLNQTTSLFFNTN